MTMSVAEFLDQYIDNTTLKADLAFQSFVGTYTSPYAQGSAYVLLHHFFGIVNGEKGAWGHARGGMGAITQAMARSAEAHGAAIEVDAPVARILVSDGCARGVELEDGRRFTSRAVASNTHPRILFERLLDPSHVEADFLQRIANYRSHSATFRMNLALDELPDFTCLRHLNDADRNVYLKGIIVFGKSIEYLEQAYIDANLEKASIESTIYILIGEQASELKIIEQQIEEYEKLEPGYRRDIYDAEQTLLQAQQDLESAQATSLPATIDFALLALESAEEQLEIKQQALTDLLIQKGQLIYAVLDPI